MGGEEAEARRKRQARTSSSSAGKGSGICAESTAAGGREVGKNGEDLVEVGSMMSRIMANRYNLHRFHIRARIFQN